MNCQLNNFLMFLLFFPCFAVFGQGGETTSDKYSLLTMPYNQRPLQLYKGQFQVNQGFQFNIRNQIFDGNGVNIRNKSSDMTYVRYHFPAEIKYGLTDFIEAGVNISYQRTGTSGFQTAYVAAGLGYHMLSYTLEEFRGMNDLLLFASLRLPVEYKFFDINLCWGIYLPTANHQPEQPRHSVTEVYHVEYDVTEHNIVYHYLSPIGSGVPVYRLSGSGKLTLQKFSFQVDAAFLFPAKTGTNIRWSHTLIHALNEFSYTAEEYGYLTDRSFHLDAALHYQMNGWLDVHFNGDYYSSWGGWTEHYGRKYANLKQQLWVAMPGFSIQVSPALRIFQTATIPLTGKNIDGRFGVSITASLNLFPFHKEN